MTRLVFIRHGESQAQVDQFAAGHNSCRGLSDLGRRQAEALRDRLALTGELRDVAAIYTSILPRAIETATIIAPALGGPTPIEECDLCEVHTGDEIDGMTWEEIRERYSDTFGGGMWDPWVPGAEAWAEFVARVGRMVTRIAKEHEDQTVVLAVHGGVVEASFAVLGGLGLPRGFHLDVTNTSITEWERTERGWLLRRFNDAAHLADVARGVHTGD